MLCDAKKLIRRYFAAVLLITVCDLIGIDFDHHASPVRLVFRNNVNQSINLKVNFFQNIPGRKKHAAKKRIEYSKFLPPEGCAVLFKRPGESLSIKVLDEKRKLLRMPEIFAAEDIDTNASTYEYMIFDDETIWQENAHKKGFEEQFSRISEQHLQDCKEAYPIFFDQLDEMYHEMMGRFIYHNEMLMHKSLSGNDDIESFDVQCRKAIKRIASFDDLYDASHDEMDQKAKEFIRKLRLLVIAQVSIIGDYVVNNYDYNRFQPPSWVWFFTQHNYRNNNVNIQVINNGICQMSLDDDRKDFRNPVLEHKLDDLVQLYKIHLMPNDRDIEAVTIKLLQAMEDDKELYNAIAVFKVNYKINDQERNLPIIVIYANPGKATAQLIVDKLYSVFDGIEGSGRVPRFNVKITSLLYWAQGDGDHKEQAFYSKYYDQPGMECYVSNIKQFLNPQAPMEDYYLIAP